MSEPKTEIIDVESIKQEKPPKPAREMSQTAIAAFFYGTLQLLFTLISSGLVLVVGHLAASFKSSDPTGLIGMQGTDSTDLDEIQQAMEELGMVDPSVTPAPDMPTTNPDPSTITGLPSGIDFTPEATPSEIVPLELLAIVITQGFGLVGLITAFISFGALSRGKSGRGLAITGFISSFLSFVIAFMVALAV